MRAALLISQLAALSSVTALRVGGPVGRRGDALRLRAAASDAPTTATSATATPPPAAWERTYPAWATEAGIAFPELRCATFEGSDASLAGGGQSMRGLGAASPSATTLPTSTPLVTLPRRATLAASASQPLPAELREWGLAESAWDMGNSGEKLALKLLHAMALLRRGRRLDAGPAGALDGYIAQLPESVETPLFWSEAEVALLADPRLAARVDKQRERWGALWRALESSSPAAASTTSREELERALACVFSRAFGGKFGGSGLSRALLAAQGALAALAGAWLVADPLQHGASSAAVLVAGLGAAAALEATAAAELVLLPVIDTANHRSNARSTIAYNALSDALELSFEEGEEGSGKGGIVDSASGQVFISYGERSNEELLLYFGFVERDNPHDVVTLAVGGGGRSGEVQVRRGGRVDPAEAAQAGGMSAVKEAAVTELARLDKAAAEVDGPQGAEVVEAGRVDVIRTAVEERRRVLKELV